MAGPTSPQVGQYLINCMTYDRFPAHEGAASVAPAGNEDDWSHRAPGPAPAALMNHECLDPFTNVCTSNTVAVRMFDRWLHETLCLSNDIDTTLHLNDARSSERSHAVIGLVPVAPLNQLLFLH